MSHRTASFIAALALASVVTPSTTFAADAAPSTPPAPPVIGGLARWIEVSSAQVIARYRAIESSAQVVTANQAQHQQALKARFRVDPAGRFAIGTGVQSGSAFTSGWNNTGAGSGTQSSDVFLKQLYADATPVTGTNIQYGSLFVARGENTEITSYDNDGYVSGLRFDVKRPQALRVDELAVTRGYLGSTATPSVFDRRDDLTRFNYWQALVAKRAGRRTTVSTDWSRVEDTDTVRAATTIKLPAAAGVQLLKVEGYRRFAHATTPAGGGFAVTAERRVVGRLTAGGGWADIDADYGGLNADRFNRGRRLFTTANLPLGGGLSLQAFYTHALDDAYPVANRTRFDALVTYSLITAFHRTGTK